MRGGSKTPIKGLEIVDDESGVSEDVRLGNTTTPMSGRQAVAYFRERWSSVSLRGSNFRRPIMQPAP
jgi:hypothetical protein